jgi:hypothetical protein
MTLDPTQLVLDADTMAQANDERRTERTPFAVPAAGEKTTGAASVADVRRLKR